MNHLNWATCVLIFSLLALCSCSTTKLPTEEVTEKISEKKPVEAPLYLFNFTESDFLSPVLEMAAAEKKLVYVDFHADWCAPCKLMEEEVYKNQELADLMNASFVNYRVDADTESGGRLMTIFEVKSLPTLLFINPKGEVLVRKSGAALYTEFKELADQALHK